MEALTGVAGTAFFFALSYVPGTLGAVLPGLADRVDTRREPGGM